MIRVSVAWLTLLGGTSFQVAAAAVDAPARPADSAASAAEETTAETPVVGEAPAEPTTAGGDKDADAPKPPDSIAPTDWVVLPRVGDYRRAALHSDPVEVRFAREPNHRPQPGDPVTAVDGRVALWRTPAQPRRANLAGGYAYAEFESPSAGVMVLEAPGAAAVWLNGAWLPGDPYRVGWLRPPTTVVAGRNRMLVHLAGPNAKPRLVRPDAAVSIIDEAATLPDLIAGAADQAVVGSVPITNASESPLEDARLRLAWSGGKGSVTPLRRIDPLLVTPVTFELPPIETPTAGTLSLTIDVLPQESEEPVASCELTVRVVDTRAMRRVTRTSPVDGSVQPYAFAAPGEPSGAAAGVVLLLHDAGQSPEQAIGAFRAPPNTWVVAPAGRGRWGFDWEDWSREDAVATLDHFLERRKAGGDSIDPARIGVTGRGMGAHGALRLATLRPDRFASIAVTNPWLSFGSGSRSRHDDPRARSLRETLTRQADADDPLRTLENLSGVAVAVACNRPAEGPTDAGRLRTALAEFHTDFAYRETSHSDAVAADHAAWLTRRASRDEAAERVAFATPDVGAASASGWVTLVATERPGEVARVDVRRSDEEGSIRGETTNVKRLKLDLGALPKPSTGMFRVRLDGGETLRFRPGRGGETLDLIRDAEDQWRRVPRGLAVPRPFGPALKTAERAGGMKSAFRHRPLLIYGTSGSEGERRWAAARARYDAHLFLYRGAGRLEVLPDTVAGTTLATDAGRDRSVILYGNSETNAAFRLLSRDAALRVGRGVASIGGRPESGDDLGLIAVRPRITSTSATVGVVGGTGVVGMRLTDRLRWFWAGAPYPDLLLFGPGALAPPTGRQPEDDVRAAGWFGYDWKAGEGVVWRDAAI